ncbi:hypothetical protein BpHYR1_042723 [Brachionus plicatilis]|uniref:Uncharacterized protein n=1 Tax=Brachionus plicatilis TaxID=10195 RepID=A0A3M7T8X7_BRAPC|nr:hypothetical protein BpHYR1_042723 [Brachionus plicatilis]
MAVLLKIYSSFAFEPLENYESSFCLMIQMCKTFMYFIPYEPMVQVRRGKYLNNILGINYIGSYGIDAGIKKIIIASLTIPQVSNLEYKPILDSLQHFANLMYAYRDNQDLFLIKSGKDSYLTYEELRTFCLLDTRPEQNLTKWSQVLVKTSYMKCLDISTTPNEVKKPRISDSGEGCFKGLENVLRASSNGLKMSQKKEIQSKEKNYTVQNLKYTISDELEDEEDVHESLLKAN